MSSPSPFDFFDDVIYINLPTRKDRNVYMLTELMYWNFPHFRRIDGVISDNPTKGFNQAQRNALEGAKGNCLILEDDCAIVEPWHLEDALGSLPADWDMIYLGANIEGTDLCSWPTPEYVAPHLRRVKQAWTTHAVGYSKAGREKILKDWDHTNGQIYDDYLRCNLEKLNAFIVYPMVADQRPGFSDIWNRETHYGFFQSGNAKMKV